MSFRTIDLLREKEPEIWDAIKMDALLENVPQKAGVNEHGIDFAVSIFVLAIQAWHLHWNDFPIALF